MLTLRRTPHKVLVVIWNYPANSGMSDKSGGDVTGYTVSRNFPRPQFSGPACGACLQAPGITENRITGALQTLTFTDEGGKRDRSQV